MSTVMYAFRARSDDHLAEQVAAVRDINKKRIFGDGGEELQVFRTSSGIIWRILEAGYGIKNRLWKDSDTFPACNYDDRGDVPDEDKENKEIADEIDKLIVSGEYQIIPLKTAPTHKTPGHQPAVTKGVG